MISKLETKKPSINFKFLVFILLSSASLLAFAELENTALKISKPTVRTDFENRIWRVDRGDIVKSKTRSKIISTLVLRNSDEMYKYTDKCDRDCKNPVLTAGTAYITGNGGLKNTLEIQPPGQPKQILALLPAYVNAEGLTDAYLTIFESTAKMPVCSLPIHLLSNEGSSFIYGTWQLKAAYSVAEGNYLSWVTAGGGDGGWQWKLNAFITMTPNCELVAKKMVQFDVSEPADRCRVNLPNFESLFTILPDGQVRQKKLPKTCLKIAIDKNPRIKFEQK